MGEVALIFIHLFGGVLAVIGLIAIVLLSAGFHIEFDWDDYDLDDNDDNEEHF